MAAVVVRAKIINNTIKDHLMIDILDSIVLYSEKCTAFKHWKKKTFLAATAALEVQMLVCVFVCHTCYNCTKALNFKVFRLKDFCRTSSGLLKDF